MKKKQKVFFSKFFKSLNYFSFFLIAFLFFSLFCHPLIAFTQDLGRHLKIGQIIIHQKSVPQTNLFSYTFPGFSFINHHWLSEVVFSLFNQAWGLNSLIFLKIVLSGTAFLSLLWLAIRHFHWMAGLTWGLAILFLFAQRTEVRPEIFSYLFLSFYLIALKSKNIKKKYFFILPLIQMTWVNMHIYFFIGPVLLFFYFVNQLIAYKFKPHPQTKKTALILIITSLVCFLNPNFLKGALYPLFVFKNYGYQVIENQSWFFMSRYIDKIYDSYFLAIFLISLTSFLITLKRQSFYQLSSFIFFSVLGFLAIRNVPVFALAMIILVTNNLFLIKKFLVNRLKIKPETVLNFKLLFFFSFIFLTFFLSCQNILQPTKKQQISHKKFGLGKIKGAEDGADFVLKNKLAGPMFNNFDIGGYLIYRLYPQYQVFVDNRPEAYPADFLQKIYIPMQNEEEKWQEINGKYNFNFIFFVHTDITPWAISFLKRISQSKNWQLVFLDDYVIIFLKKNEANKALMEKYSVNQESFRFDCPSLDCSIRLNRVLKIIE